MTDRKFAVLAFLMPPLILGGFFAGFWIRGRQDRVSKDQVDKVRLVAEKIRGRYVNEIEEDKLFEGAYDGMMAKLDPYCEYFTAQEWTDFNDMNLEGKFGGVGILVEGDKETGFINVVTPLEDSPAFAEDILPGDKIVEVDGKSVKGQQLTDVVRRIKGTPGTPVTITFVRKGRDPNKITLTRALIQIKSVKEKMLDGQIGYIRISDFSSMMGLFDKAAAGLILQGAKAFIIDLRFNGGGLLEECVRLSDRFLPEGDIIVTTKGRTSVDNRIEKATGKDDLPNLPLVVLVNEGTASASEIFSGAMKDHKRGVLVGTRTFGKGSVQTPFEMPDHSRVKITTARYYTPNGTSVHREEGKKDYGLDPDYRIEMSPEEYTKLLKHWNDERIRKGEKPKEDDKFVDLQLAAGLEVIKAKLENREPKVEERILKK